MDHEDPGQSGLTDLTGCESLVAAESESSAVKNESSVDGTTVSFAGIADGSHSGSAGGSFTLPVIPVPLEITAAPSMANNSANAVSMAALAAASATATPLTSITSIGGMTPVTIPEAWTTPQAQANPMPLSITPVSTMDTSPSVAAAVEAANSMMAGSASRAAAAVNLQPLNLGGAHGDVMTTDFAGVMGTPTIAVGEDGLPIQTAANLGTGGPRPTFRQWSFEEQFKQLYELDDEPDRKEFLDSLFEFMHRRGTPVQRIPIMAKGALDFYKLFAEVVGRGGVIEVIAKKQWREVANSLKIPTSITSAAFTLRTQYIKYLYPFECETKGLSKPEELTALMDANRERMGMRSTPQTPCTPSSGRNYSLDPGAMATAMGSVSGEPAAKRLLTSPMLAVGHTNICNMRLQQASSDSSGNVVEVAEDTNSVSVELNSLVVSMEINGQLFQGVLYAKTPPPLSAVTTTTAPSTPHATTAGMMTSMTPGATNGGMTVHVAAGSGNAILPVPASSMAIVATNSIGMQYPGTCVTIATASGGSEFVPLVPNPAITTALPDGPGGQETSASGTVSSEVGHDTEN